MNHLLILIGMFFILGSGSAWANSAKLPQVIVTLKPVHSLVAAVMQNVAHPLLLIPGNASPHSYALKPSDAKQLHNADLLIWVGTDMETFLARMVDNLPATVTTVALMELPNMHRLPNRDSEENDAHQSHETHHPGQWDPHIWLDPNNAQVIVQHIGLVLSQRFPEFAPQFQQNVDHTLKRLRQLDRDIQQKLAPIQKIPFVVYHDAYYYFEHHFGLHSLGRVTLNPGQPSGAKSIGRLRHLLKTSAVTCLFAEPQFPTAIIQTMIENLPIQVGLLDPLGISLTEGEEHYFQLLHALANNLTDCLQKGR